METRSNGSNVTDLDIFVEELMDLMSGAVNQFITEEHVPTLDFIGETNRLHRYLLKKAYETCTDKSSGLTMYSGMIMMALRSRRSSRGL